MHSLYDPSGKGTISRAQVSVQQKQATSESELPQFSHELSGGTLLTNRPVLSHPLSTLFSAVGHSLQEPGSEANASNFQRRHRRRELCQAGHSSAGRGEGAVRSCVKEAASSVLQHSAQAAAMPAECRRLKESWFRQEVNAQCSCSSTHHDCGWAFKFARIFDSFPGFPFSSFSSVPSGLATRRHSLFNQMTD